MLRLFAILVVIVSGAAVLTGAACRAWLTTDGGQAWLRHEVSEKSGFHVGWKRLSGPLLTGVDLDEPTLASRDGKLHARAARAELRWSLASVLDGDPSLRVRVVRPKLRMSELPALPRLPARRARVQLTVEDGRTQADLRARVDGKKLDLDGNARVGRGRVRVKGRLSQGRGRLRVQFRNLELPNSRDHMVLTGVSRVTVRGQRVAFWVDGSYRHRRVDVQVPGASRLLPRVGRIEGGGTVRLKRRPAAGFVLHLHDRGHATKLLSSQAESHLVLRGRYDRRLHLNLESR